MPAILIIDPDEPSRKLARVVLGAEGWEVIGASDFAEAWARLAHVRPQLIATALVPWPHAFVQIADLARHGIPIVAVTALSDPEVERSARAAGCAGVITKPIDVATFATQLLTYLGDSHDDRIARG